MILYLKETIIDFWLVIIVGTEKSTLNYFRGQIRRQGESTEAFVGVFSDNFRYYYWGVIRIRFRIILQVNKTYENFTRTQFAFDFVTNLLGVL